jgi:hypothetical protein
MRDREDKGLQNPRIAAQTVSLGLPFWEELAKGLDLRLNPTMSSAQPWYHIAIPPKTYLPFIPN